MIKLTEIKTNSNLSPPPSKNLQLEKILGTNPAQDNVHTWIRTVDDILTFEEAQEQVGFGDVTPDFSYEMVRKSLNSGEIVVYSSHPITIGGWVTPSRMEAQSYAGSEKIYQKTVKLEDVAWVDEIQGQYAPII